ncbi:MAG: ADP-glyceromanno-heptose 6-epimerase [Verrucomicrobiota bacterium]|nr:ADP-glyceromanno-heptose 6-epimerase [Verrucomicrobiota bacterium]
MDLSRTTILVTGGAGFIGSALIWALNQRGIDRILVSDYLDQSEKWKNLVPLRFMDYIEADMLMKRIEERPQSLVEVGCVLHLGACSATTEKNGRYLIDNNFEYTKQLCNWTLSKSARFVYASSAATYGDGAQGMLDDENTLEKLRPLNMYGYSKHLFDLHARRHGWLSRIAGMKYFNVFGPNEDHKDDMRSVVHKAFGQIRATGRVQLFKSYHRDYPDGGQKRDFLYVKDAVEMTLHLASTRTANGLFNLGSGKAHTWIDLVTPIFDAMQMPAKIDFIDMPESLRAKYQYFTEATIDKLRASGYTRPMTSLDDAVIDYVRNYLSKGQHLGDS